MPKLIIPGKREAVVADQKADIGRFLSVTVHENISIDTSRAGAESVEISNVPDDAIIELTASDGGKRWILAADLRKELPHIPTRSAEEAAGEEDVIHMPTVLAESNERGLLGNLFLKGLRILNVDLGRGATQTIIKKLEAQLSPGPGLYHCPDPNDLGKQVTPKDLSGTQPILLFIHGTASSTAGSFGALTLEGDSSIWKSLKGIYGNRIIAFEHETLSKSPIENAIELLESLPPKTRLHIVSHSRGGLIGELLSRTSLTFTKRGRRAYFDRKDIRLFERASKGGNRKTDITGLKKLNRLFKSQHIQVDRFVRVACPAAGTTLASRRLDRYLTVIVNLLARIPIPGVGQLFDLTTSLLMAVVKKRMDPKEIPGLEAQMPGSPLIRMINNPALEVPASLAIISGDARGAGILGSLKILAANLFFRADHDLVVNTASMYGGGRRKETPRYFFDQGKTVDHFHYFGNPKTQKAVLSGLQGKTETISGFRTISSQQLRISRILAKKRSGLPQPTVLVIPGLMGSSLAVGEKTIWPNPVQISQGEFSALAIDNTKVVAEAPIDSAYAQLIEYLQGSHEVLPFAYDWRQSLYQSADLLAKALTQHLQRSKQAIRIIAHDMGGLVVRMMMIKHPEIWEQIQAREGSRLLLLGTPNGGTYSIPLLLTGKASVFQMLALLDLTQDPKALLEIIWQYPGLLEMLPASTQAGSPDFYSVEFWEQLRQPFGEDFPIPDIDTLNSAAQVQIDLRAHPLDSGQAMYIAGQAAATPSGMEWMADHPEIARFTATPLGDGRVSWDSGIPTALTASTWYMEAEHGQLANHPAAFPALLELLESGTTQLMSQTPPDVSDSRGSLVFEAIGPSVFPGITELEAAAMGYSPHYTEEACEQKVQVYVSHGNLENAHFPVAVGHHKGDGIVSAESALDYYLKGRLRERHAVGVYPGEIETAEVILQPHTHPPGGIVVGLGDFGSLTAGKLARSFGHAVLALALKNRERELSLENQESNTPDSEAGYDSVEIPGITTLLIGSGFGGLTLREAIRAVLSGVRRANERIRVMSPDGLRPIEQIEFIEIYEDRSIQAIRALRSILKEQRFRHFSINRPDIRKLEGGRRQLLDQEEPDWWHRFKVEGTKNTSDKSEAVQALRFTSLTDRARAEVSNLPTQRELVDALIRQAVRQPYGDLALAQSMFELLIPNAFKDYAADRKNILWIVDTASAAYPWELLHDPSQGEQDPVATRAGMLRQLAVSNYRTQVHSTSELRALVVGDPQSNFPVLKAAQKEAEMVGNMLEGERFSVEKVLRKGSADVIKALFKHSYQIVHLAGHGVVNHPPLQYTGMVLGEDSFLTPAVINQMRTVPDFVFINCCHLGKSDVEDEATQQDRNQLAANLGTQLISMGVRGVIAAGWAVDDAAAKTFAEVFYTQFLEGMPFGESVRLARESTYQNHSHTNTWGAYQCYGDPYYTLRGNASSARKERKQYADPLEVLIDLENIITEIGSASSRWFQVLQKRLAQIVSDIPDLWKDHGEVVETLAKAYADLNLFAEAAVYFEKVRTLEHASYSIKTLEQYANLKIHWGIDTYIAPNANAKARSKSKRLIQEAIRELKVVIQLGETTERMNLLGSAYKRQAMVQSTARARINSLEKSQMYYATGRVLEQQRAQDEQPFSHLYSRLNQETIAAILARYGQAKIKTDAALSQYLNRQLQELARDKRKHLSFWNLAYPANIYELKLLLEGASTESEYAPKIIRCYEKAWQYGGSYKKRNSIMNQYDFLIAMMTPPANWPSTHTGRIRKQQDKEMNLLKAVFEQLLTDLEGIMQD